MQRGRYCFDRVSDTYDSTRKPPPPEVLDALARQLGGCRAVLDVGAGTGRLARPLLDRGVRVVGVDVSPSMLAVARGKGIECLVMGDACRLPFPADAFDAVLAVHVMHLVDDLSLLLAEARRVCCGLLVTLADRWDPSDFVDRGYQEALAARGFRLPLGIDGPEWPLAEVVQPSIQTLATTTEVTGDYSEFIGNLERREYSMTWEVPEDLHRAAIAEVRERYAGPRPPTRCESFVLGWDVESLTDAALDRVRERLGVGAGANGVESRP